MIGPSDRHDRSGLDAGGASPPPCSVLGMPSYVCIGAPEAPVSEVYPRDP
jgi:hypothetical protein